MNELYWITRLDALLGWLISFSVVCGIALFLSIVGFIICKSDYHRAGDEEAREWMVFCSKLFKIIVPSFILLVILTILTPTTKQALLIYGVGNTRLH